MTNAADRWARLRFSIVAPLLASPPAKGELRSEMARLAEKHWLHPITGQSTTFGLSTLERWYYRARAEQDPVAALRRPLRKDAGQQPSLTLELRQALRTQYRQHDDWSYQLHYDNLVALVGEKPELGPLPSYATIRRWMKSQGLFKKRRRRTRDTPGAEAARRHLETFEVRSFEVVHVNGLWHLDFHLCSRPVLIRDGRWVTPKLLGILDDASRLCCHAQWYLDETAETLVHGLCQALQKRGLCRALLTDNGSAMIAAETVQGLVDLGIAPYTTLPHSPYQNAKQEAFWVPVESRLMPMLKNVHDLTLDLLNEATQAWYEQEHNREVHSEIGQAPLTRFLAGPSVARDCPGSDDLRRAFRLQTVRTQRRSDGTIPVEGLRFEVPNRFRHLERITLRYARWNLASVDLVDPRDGTILAPLYPIDKAKNADAERRRLEPISSDPEPPPAAGGIAPLLKKLMADYAATGLPPAYLPKEETR